MRPPCRSDSRTAFTLVELLVVISIIVLLVAILVPALGHAFYLADLARCSSNQSGIAKGATTYSHSYKRYYPNRPGNLESSYVDRYWPWTLANKRHNDIPGNVRDVRPILRDFIDIKLLSDPFCDGVDLSEQATAASDRVDASYNLFFGWGFINEYPMRKFGDPFTVTTPRTINSNVRYTPNTQFEFTVLVSDIDFAVLIADTNDPSSSNTSDNGSHPDSRRRMVLEAYQNAGVNRYSGAKYSKPNDGRLRGTIEINVGFADGSVVRYDDIEHNDERMIPVPDADDKEGYFGNSGGESLQQFLQLPNR